MRDKDRGMKDEWMNEWMEEVKYIEDGGGSNA